MKTNHPKVQAALDAFGVDKFNAKAERLLESNPKCRIVLGLLGGASVARNPNARNWCYSAGKTYPRPAVRYERGKGIVGIWKHSGPYLNIAL